MWDLGLMSKYSIVLGTDLLGVAMVLVFTVFGGAHCVGLGFS